MLVFRGHIIAFFSLFLTKSIILISKSLFLLLELVCCAAAQTLNKAGTRPNLEESIAVIRANACRQADFGSPNELHLY